MRRILLITLLLAYLAVAAAQAGFHLGGEVRTTFGVAVDGKLPVASACLKLDANGAVGAGVLPDASYQAELIGCYHAAQAQADLHLGTAFATVYLGNIDLMVGQQVAFWGSTDAVNPEDVINPRDLSYPPADPQRQRIPIPMLRAIVHDPIDNLKLDLVLVPVFRASEEPGPQWQRPPGTAPALPPGVHVVGQGSTRNNLPAATLANVQFGARATLNFAVLSGADVSLAYFHGIRTTPTASTRLVPTPTPGQYLIQPLLNYDRYDLLAVDFAAATSYAVFRGEAAYTFTHDPNGTNPSIGNPGYEAVLEAEHTFPSGALTTLEAILQHTDGDQGHNGSTDISSLATVSYQATPRFTTQAAWLHDYSDGSGMLRPRLSYTFAGGVTGEADLSIFYGRDGSRYGAWKDNSQLRLSLAYSF